MIIEAYSRINEQAKITGVALIPRISRNNNLYTKAELKRFDNVEVPLNWEHNEEKRIGTVTFHYNPDLETVYYEGMVTDEATANLVKNKTLFTSIEADPTEMKEICNAPNDCFSMAFGLTPKALAITETPGVPETTVKVIESYVKKIKENCVDDCLKSKVDSGKQLDDQDVAICHSECGENYKELQKENRLIIRKIEILEKAVFCPDCGKPRIKKKEHSS